MSGTLRWWRWLVLCTVLAACAATQSAVQEETGEQEAIASLEDWCSAEGSLVALCDAGQCGMYRCREVVEALTPGRVRLAQMVQAPPLVGTGSSVQRYWGSAEALPETVQPVFIIPWNAQPQTPLPSQVKLQAEQETERRKPHEKHHIFPQEEGLREWFGSKGIKIHEYTMPLLIEVHRRIHHQPPIGGDWNEAWRRYQREHEDAPKEEIMRYAGQLIFEFGLAGPVLPYYRRWTQPPPIGGY